MKNLAEAIRWLGFLVIISGLCIALSWIGFRLGPTVMIVTACVIDQVGVGSAALILAGLGVGIFYIGEWISPFSKS